MASSGSSHPTATTGARRKYRNPIHFRPWAIAAELLELTGSHRIACDDTRTIGLRRNYELLAARIDAAHRRLRYDNGACLLPRSARLLRRLGLTRSRNRRGPLLPLDVAALRGSRDHAQHHL